MRIRVGKYVALPTDGNGQKDSAARARSGFDAAKAMAAVGASPFPARSVTGRSPVSRFKGREAAKPTLQPRSLRVWRHGKLDWPTIATK